MQCIGMVKLFIRGDGASVYCDVCGSLIDVVESKYWLKKIKAGELYAGKLFCWKDEKPKTEDLKDKP